METVTLREAKDKGLKYYFTGIPCKNGHTTMRSVSNRACLECTKIVQRQSSLNRYYKNKEEINVKKKQRYYQNIEKYKKTQQVWRAQNKTKITARDNRRRAAKIMAVPLWSETDKIHLVYKKAKHFEMHVDHAVPLQGKSVCGLHVWANLQLLLPEENLSKKNSHWPDMWE